MTEQLGLYSEGSLEQLDHWAVMLPSHYHPYVSAHAHADSGVRTRRTLLWGSRLRQCKGVSTVLPWGLGPGARLGDLYRYYVSTPLPPHALLLHSASAESVHDRRRGGRPCISA